MAFRKRMTPLFHKLVETVIEEPHLTYSELAKKVGRAPSTISCIMSSDMFKYHLDKKREEYSAAHRAAISYQLGRTMNAALKACADAIEMGEANPRFALEVVKELRDLTTEKPYNGEQNSHSSPSVLIQISGDTISRAREKARISHQEQQDHQSIENERIEHTSAEREVSLIEGRNEIREEGE